MKRVFSVRGYRWVSDTHAKLNGCAAACATLIVVIVWKNPRVPRPASAPPDSSELWMNVRRLMLTSGPARSSDGALK